MNMFPNRPSIPTRKPSPLTLALSAAGLIGAAAAASGAEQQLDEVRVHAERGGSFTGNAIQVGTFRDLDPLEVPLTNNLVTREVLDAQGARTLHGALRNTAGVAHAQIGNAAYDNISIRGLLVDNQRNYRLNGSLPIVNLIDTPLENKERVEVLKGAASLYYGLVPPSGIVNLVTKRPADKPVTTLNTSVNDHGGADAHLDFSRRYGEGGDKGIRLNVAAGRQEVGLENYDGERSLFALAHDWRINSAVNFRVDVEHYRKDVSEPAAILYKPGMRLPDPVDNRLNHAGEWQRYDAKATNVLARTDITLSDAWMLTLEAGQAETERDRNFSTFNFADPATGDGTLNISYVRDQAFKNRNARGELVGSLTTGPVTHELTFGATTNIRTSRGESAPQVKGVAQNYFDPRNIERIAAGTWKALTPARITDRGVYAFDRMSFGEHWQVLAGVRWGRYRSEAGTAKPYEASNSSPNLSVIYKLNPNLSFYGSYLEALEETGVAGVQYANAGEVLEPAVNKQKEVGVKARLGSGMMLQAAYFDIERPQTTTDAANRFVIGGRSDYRGIELSAGGDLGRDWSVLASALFMDAEIVRVGPANAAQLGNTPQNTAKRTLSLFAEYRVPGVPGWSLNGGLYHVGERAVNNLEQAHVPSYTTVSLGTRYATRWGATPVKLQANLDNATDRDYWLGTGDNYLAAGLPRTLRVAASFEF